MRTISTIGWLMLQILAVSVLGHQVALEPGLIQKLKRRPAADAFSKRAQFEESGSYSKELLDAAVHAGSHTFRVGDVKEYRLGELLQQSGHVGDDLEGMYWVDGTGSYPFYGPWRAHPEPETVRIIGVDQKTGTITVSS